MISLMNALNKLNSIYPSKKPYSVRKFANKIGMHNPISVRGLIRKSQQYSYPNPFNQELWPYFNSNAPNRTVWYTGRSYMGLPDPAEITKVKNICNFLMKLCILDVQGNILVGPVSLAPNESTDRFNMRKSIVDWGAVGPESGNITGQHLTLKIEISWKVND